MKFIREFPFEHENVSYNYSRYSKKWEFQVKNTGFTLLEACKGQKNAHKVARIVASAFKRRGYYDNLARSNVDRLLGRA